MLNVYIIIFVFSSLIIFVFSSTIIFVFSFTLWIELSLYLLLILTATATFFYFYFYHGPRQLNHVSCIMRLVWHVSWGLNIGVCVFVMVYEFSQANKTTGWTFVHFIISLSFPIPCFSIFGGLILPVIHFCRCMCILYKLFHFPVCIG